MLKKKVCVFLSIMLLCVAMTGSFVGGTSAATSQSGQIGGKNAQLVYVSPSTVTAKVALANGSVVSDRAAKSIIDGAAGQGRKVVAAVNGAYFNAYYKAAAGISFPANCARVYGTILQDGKLINGGGTNQAATLGFTSGGTALIDWVSLSPKVTFSGPITSIHWPSGQRSVEITPWGLNNYYADASAIMQFTDEMTLPVTCPATSNLVFITGGKITKITAGGTFTVPKGTDVIVYHATAIANAKKWDQFPAVGDSVGFAVKRTPATGSDQSKWDAVTNAIGVGPMILQNGVSVTSKDKVTDQKQAPSVVNQKSFVAVMQDGRLLLGTCVASFNQIAAYLAGIGAVDAMSLDGGASSTLYTASNGFVKPAGRNLSNMIVFLDKPAEVYVPFSNAAESIENFTDVKGHWAEAYMNKVMDKHMYSGTSKTTFGPESSMTRAMFVTALGKHAEAQGKLETSATATNAAYAVKRFSDVKSGQWYTAYAGWAEQADLVTGTGANSFSPNAPIEREQLCIILMKYQSYLGQGITSDEGTARFTDDGKISDWAMEAVYRMRSAGIVNGYEDGSFKPQDNVTRGEAAVMLTKGLGL